MFWNAKKNAVIAIDLGTDAVRIVGSTRRKGRASLQFWDEQQLAEGPTSNLPERHLSALGDLLAKHRIRNNMAMAALPTSMVLTRTVKLDTTKSQSAEEQILWTLENCLPFNPRDIIFDFWPVGDPAAARAGEVMVVATQASVIDKYLRGFEKLHLQCTHLDVAPCAIASLIGQNTKGATGTVCTIVLSAAMGFFAVVERGQVHFWRPFDLAVGTKSGAPVGANRDRMGDEISKCFSHMATTMQLDSITEMQIYGNGSNDPDLLEFLSKQFQVTVTCPSPFESILGELGAEAVAEPSSDQFATNYCTAVGLALQSV